ncbi:redoxin domain-containing protein [Chitinophaga sp. OAE865]|uniref:redoxin domain-containing protein n=1 Tax=Chitinophaga sp. OAE865 TaxID=2817898 RepID=UPI001AE6E09E
MKITFKHLSAYTIAAAALLCLPSMAGAQSKQKGDSLVGVINKHPENIAAHEAYLMAMRKDSAGVVKQYQRWIKQFPKVAAVQYGLGRFYTGMESPAARPFLLKAVEMDPKLADAWQELSVDAERWGEFDKAREFMGKASAADPNNPDYFFYYANAFEKDNPQKYREMCNELIKKFPESQRGAQALYWIAFREPDLQKKKALYEQMRRDFPVTKFSWSNSGMDEYFDLLLSESPSEALKLASELAATPGLEAESKDAFEKDAKLARQFVAAEKLLAENKAGEAATMLNEIKAKRWGSMPQTLALLKAKVAASGGHPQQAYDTLMKYYAATPARSLKAPLLAYGKEAGKTESAVYSDLKQRLNADAKEASFSLEQYLASGKTTMQDYKGKVVLLTFWFPGCGPCRGEFPHFEKVLKNFKGQPVSYLGINVVRDQDEYVVPFVKSSKYSFIPLKDVEANRKNLPARGAPTNYLIDQDGKIIFKNFMIQNHDAELMLEDMIRLLLEKQV